MPGIFSTFNIAKSGLSTQQKAIDVTSHNIANANTDGYSRQRAEMQTTTPYCMPSMNGTTGVGQFGTGVEVSSIDRIRDSFLDYQVRVENGVNGQYSGRDKFLSEVENIFNEPSDTGISSLMGKFFDSWQTLSGQAETSNSRTVVIQQSLALTDELNHTSKQLQELKTNAQTVIKDTISDVNSMLSQISQVNQQIAQIKVSGNNPNDLMDRRDLLLDQLSEKLGITIDKKNLDGIDLHVAETDENNPKSPVVDAGPPKKTINLVQLVNSDKTARFSYINSIEPSGTQKLGEAGNYKVTYYKNGDTTNEANKVVLNDITLTADQYKQMDECRMLWANNDGTAIRVDESNNVTAGSPTTFSELKLLTPNTGELNGYMSVQEDVGNYIVQLNKLAKGIALSVNAVHSQSAAFTADDTTSSSKIINNFFVNSNPSGATYGEADEQNITAENITVNSELVDDVMAIQTGTSETSGESDGKRALAIAQLRDKLMNITSIDTTTKRSEFLTKSAAGDLLKTDATLGVSTIINNTDGMKIDNYYKDTVDKLGIQSQQAKRMVKNEAVLLSGFQESRDSVSGVSLDEEMANLIQFQHAYQANAKIISTVDELLDVIINGLKK